MGTQIWEVAMNVFHSVVATLCPTKQGTPTFKKGPYLTRYKGSLIWIPSYINMNFERWDIVLFQNIYASDFKMEIWKVYNIQTFMYQPEGSNFKPYPFFNWTQDKCSCITCKKEIRQKSFADHRLYNVQCTIYARRSKKPIILSPWILSPKQISFRSWFIPLSTWL